MPNAKKLARARHARQRQEAQMKNLAKGAAEAAAAARQNQQVQNPKGDTNDPRGQVLSGGGDTFEVRVVSAGAKPFAQGGAGNAMVQKMPAGGGRSSSGMSVKVSSGRSQRSGNANVNVQKVSDPTMAPRNYGGGQIVPQPAAPQPAPSQIPVQNHQSLQNFEMPQPVPQAQVARADVTVYLTCFERPGYFRRQLQALRAQTVQPAHLVVIVNRGEVNLDEPALSAVQATLIRANANLGPWFRFVVALEAPTKYVCFLDDDTLPGPGWLEAAIARLEDAERDPELGTFCVASAGEVFRSDDPNDRFDVGPQSPRDEEVEVDVGRQGWIFRKDLLLPFMATPRQGSGQIGWAMHLSATLQLNDVLTIVLPYTPNNKEAWGMLETPSQERSLSAAIEMRANQGAPNLAFLREQLYRGYRNLGWAPLALLAVEADEGGEATASG